MVAEEILHSTIATDKVVNDIPCEDEIAAEGAGIMAGETVVAVLKSRL